MRSCFIVHAKPHVKIRPQLIDWTIHIAECDTIELIENGLVEALINAVGLWTLGLGLQQDSPARSVNMRSRLVLWLSNNGSGLLPSG